MVTACAELHDLKEEVLRNQKKLESIRPESPAQVRVEEHAGLCLGLGVFTAVSQWFLEGVGWAAGPAGRPRKRKFIFSEQVSWLQNKQHGQRGLLRPLDTDVSQIITLVSFM